MFYIIPEHDIIYCILKYCCLLLDIDVLHFDSK